MLKRPCAIVLTPDQKSILCADKFGDVYSLPLLEPSYEGSTVTDDGLAEPSIEEDEATKKPFVPAANVKTVHTLRNRVALQHQQALAKSVVKPKNSNIEHRLLLGHVSMLTDLLCLSVSDSMSNTPQERTYILTSDRDEHIRISRGMPQAHIIEGYCLGHEEFVSKLCIPRWHKQLLISGGGDDYLLTWNWFSGEILQKVNIRCHVDDFKKQSISAINSVSTGGTLAPDVGHNSESPIAISGIWAVEGLGATPGNAYGEVVVACEGYVVLPQKLRSNAKALAVVFLPFSCTILVPTLNSIFESISLFPAMFLISQL
jgi:tRNA (guanine-N(7)-)-methyltransferase subunit TRM82